MTYKVSIYTEDSRQEQMYEERVETMTGEELFEFISGFDHLRVVEPGKAYDGIVGSQADPVAVSDFTIESLS